jgi:hypothetical protein
MTNQDKEVLKEIIAEQEKIAVAVLELQAIANGGDPRLTRELKASAVKQLYDTLRKKIDALP